MGINDLFPIYGITLGKTKISEIARSADLQIKVSDGEALVVNENAVFVQPSGRDVITIALLHGYIPEKWKKVLDLNQGMSTDECVKVLRQKGYSEFEAAAADSNNFNKIAFFDNNTTLAFVLSFDSVMGLDGIRIVFSKCPKCESEDVEALNILDSEHICNTCGYKWEYRNLYWDLEEQLQGIDF